MKNLSLSILFAFVAFGCSSSDYNPIDNQSSVDTSSYEFAITSNFDLELTNSESPSAWTLMWNETEDDKIEGVLVGDWGRIEVAGVVDSERTITFAQSAREFGPNGINLIYFIIPGGQLTNSFLMTADAFNVDGHFFNAQMSAGVLLR